MTDGPTHLDAFLAAREHAEAFEDLSAQDVNRMSYAEWAARTGRPSISQLAAQAVSYPAPQPQQAPPGQAPRTVPEAQHPPAPDPQGIDSDSPAYFHAWRAQRQRGGEGLGIFDAPGRQEYADAARQQSGRTGLSASNVVEAPRLTGRHVRQDSRLDQRTAARRFSVPGNAFNL